MGCERQRDRHPRSLTRLALDRGIAAQHAADILVVALVVALEFGGNAIFMNSRRASPIAAGILGAGKFAVPIMREAALRK
jgi:hypothetical protein